MKAHLLYRLACTAIFVALLAACTTVGTPSRLDPTPPAAPRALTPIPVSTRFLPATPRPGEALSTPTPDIPHPLQPLRSEAVTHYVNPGDTLKKIAQNYNIGMQVLLSANDIPNPDIISVGQPILIPPPQPLPAPDLYKIIPDSELINSPVNGVINWRAEVVNRNGQLANYQETIDGKFYSGLDIVERVSLEQSINPRLLISLLEYRTNFISSRFLPAESIEYPLGYFDPSRKGLYFQLSWAANQLNFGYYAWKLGSLSAIALADDTLISMNPQINAGTAAVQFLLAQLTTQQDWDKAISPQGFPVVHENLFGYPFQFAIEPVIPADLSQPLFVLPFEKGTTWSFTGGPHGGWADGSAWAALDFAPPGEGQGCVISSDWVTAVADGIIVYTQNGLVIQDLDDDGIWQAGWSIIYLHIDSQDRVAQGSRIAAGDHIGHPSCEGGVSNGAHLHLARRYNGEWIAADGGIPFNLDGWISEGDGIVYNGFLRRDGYVVEAWDSFRSENQISR